MTVRSKELEKILTAYRTKLEAVDVDLPSLYLEDKSAHTRKTPIIETNFEELPDLSGEIDKLWDEIENRRIGPNAQRNLWNISAAVLAGLAIGSLSVYVYQLPKLPNLTVRETGSGLTIASIPFPAGQSRGLTLGRGAFLSFDADSRELVVLDPGRAEVVRRFPFPNGSATGIAWSDRGLLSVGGEGGWIYRHDPASYVILEKQPSPGGHPSAIHWDGNTLWTADSVTGKLYRHSGDGNFRVVASREISAQDLAGIARAGEYIWVASRTSRMLSRYRIGSGLTEAGSAHIGHLIPPGSRLAGIAIEGDWVWLLTDSPSELHRVPRSRIQFTLP